MFLSTLGAEKKKKVSTRAGESVVKVTKHLVYIVCLFCEPANSGVGGGGHFHRSMCNDPGTKGGGRMLRDLRFRYEAETLDKFKERERERERERKEEDKKFDTRESSMEKWRRDENILETSTRVNLTIPSSSRKSRREYEAWHRRQGENFLDIDE